LAALDSAEAIFKLKICADAHSNLATLDVSALFSVTAADLDGMETN
jgi:hypothetical protein